MPRVAPARASGLSVPMRKLVRSLQVLFPGMLEAKFALMRVARNALRSPFEADFRALALFPDEEGALYLDVGANRGQSADAILMFREHARILLFEPNPVLCEKLARQYRADPRIVIHDYALGEASEEARLVVPYYRGWMFDGLASFDEAEASSWLRGRMLGYDERHLRLERLRCRIRRLDELDLRPFFVKLDVQGYELAALRGGERTLRACQPVLLVEHAHEQIVAYLAGLGYRRFAFRGGRFAEGERGEPNTFFMTPRRAALVRDHIVPGPPRA